MTATLIAPGRQKAERKEKDDGTMVGKVRRKDIIQGDIAHVIPRFG